MSKVLKCGEQNWINYSSFSHQHLSGPKVCVVLASRNLFNSMAAVESRARGLNHSFEDISEALESVFYSPVQPEKSLRLCFFSFWCSALVLLRTLTLSVWRTIKSQELNLAIKGHWKAATVHESIQWVLNYYILTSCMCERTDVDQKQFQWPEQTFAES